MNTLLPITFEKFLLNALHAGALSSEHAPPNSLLSRGSQGVSVFIPDLHPEDAKQMLKQPVPWTPRSSSRGFLWDCRALGHLAPCFQGSGQQT